MEITGMFETQNNTARRSHQQGSVKAANICTSMVGASRFKLKPDLRDNAIGFRLALSAR
jgi:formylglycine-generating enzyme required for sulfatase activity